MRTRVVVVALCGVGLLVLGLLSAGLLARAQADDPQAMLETVHRGLQDRDQRLQWLSLRARSEVVMRDPEFEAWRAERLTAHFGTEHAPRPAETWSLYVLKRMPGALYYAETPALLPDEEAPAEPFLEVAAYEGRYVRVSRPPLHERASVLVNVGAVEELQFNPAVLDFLLLGSDGEGWAEVTRAPGWRWLGVHPCEGTQCHVLGTGTSEESSRDAIWVDAARGFAVVRRVLRYEDGELSLHRVAESWQQLDDRLWLPTTVVEYDYSSSTRRDADGACFGKHLVRTKTVFEVEYADAHQLQAQDFQVVVPEGAFVYDATKDEWTLETGGER